MSFVILKKLGSSKNSHIISKLRTKISKGTEFVKSKIDKKGKGGVNNAETKTQFCQWMMQFHSHKYLYLFRNQSRHDLVAY